MFHCNSIISKNIARLYFLNSLTFKCGYMIKFCKWIKSRGDICHNSQRKYKYYLWYFHFLKSQDRNSSMPVLRCMCGQHCGTGLRNRMEEMWMPGANLCTILELLHLINNCISCLKSWIWWDVFVIRASVTLSFSEPLWLGWNPSTRATMWCGIR